MNLEFRIYILKWENFTCFAKEMTQFRVSFLPLPQNVHKVGCSTHRGEIRPFRAGGYSKCITHTFAFFEGM